MLESLRQDGHNPIRYYKRNLEQRTSYPRWKLPSPKVHSEVMVHRARSSENARSHPSPQRRFSSSYGLPSLSTLEKLRHD